MFLALFIFLIAKSNLFVARSFWRNLLNELSRVASSLRIWLGLIKSILDQIYSRINCGDIWGRLIFCGFLMQNSILKDSWDLWCTKRSLGISLGIGRWYKNLSIYLSITRLVLKNSALLHKKLTTLSLYFLSNFIVFFSVFGCVIISA